MSIQSNDQTNESNDSPRNRLLAILEYHDIPVAGFDDLRADAYEKHLARHSLDQLDAFYGRLLKRTEGFEELREQCPPWSDGSKYQGKLPSIRTLTGIRHRIGAGRTINQLGEHLKLMETFKAHLTGLPSTHLKEAFDVLVNLLSNELLTAKLDGTPLLQNLPAFDRLLRASTADFRRKHSEKRLQLDEAGHQLRLQRLDLQREQVALKYKLPKSNPAPAVEPPIEKPLDMEAELAEMEAQADIILNNASEKLQPPQLLKDLVPPITSQPVHEPIAT